MRFDAAPTVRDGNPHFIDLPRGESHLREHGLAVDRHQGRLTLTDTTEALRPGKTCLRFTLRGEGLPNDAEEALLRFVEGYAGMAELFAALAAMDPATLPDEGAPVAVYRREEASKDVFSPLARLKPLPTGGPKRWDRSAVLRGLLNGQLTAHRRFRLTDDYAWDAASGFGQGDVSPLWLAEQMVTGCGFQVYVHEGCLRVSGPGECYELATDEAVAAA